MKIPSFPLQQATAFCCHKQHILPGSQAESIEEVATSLVGIHAARLITPFFALRARLHDLNHLEIDLALHRDKTLIKARCMRGTLHLLPQELFQNAHRATLTKRLGVCNALYKKLGIGQEEALEIANVILELLQDGPLSSAAIEQGTLASVAQRKQVSDKRWTVVGVRAVVKELWESAKLCYINGNTEFASETRLYGITAKMYPTFCQEETVDDAAVRSLVENHIRGYGPATTKDIVWWSGIEKTRVTRAIEQLAKHLTTIEIQGSVETFWITNSDLDALKKFGAPAKDWVAILAHEDPSLKGYYSSRWRYISPHNYDLLFNDIGESRPAIMLNGQVVGIWALDKVKGRISKTIFEPLTASQKKLVEREIKIVHSTLPPMKGSANFELFE